MAKPTWFLLARAYAQTPWVRLLLCKRFGASHQSYLWGLVMPDVAEEIAAATGLPLEWDDVPYTGDPAYQPEELTKVSEQGSLFT
jgi:hypothetical protein